MTRSTLKRALRRRLRAARPGARHLVPRQDRRPRPLLAGSGLERFLKDAYEYLRDMSLLIATGGVAYITNMFQKRSSFVEGSRRSGAHHRTSRPCSPTPSSSGRPWTST